jgi:Lrp/AsnC family leucine-responsive transcriptional regulator
MLRNGELDEIDIKILDILQKDARMDTTRIARLVHRTFTPIHERIAQLQQKGFIRSFTAVLDKRLMGRPTLMVTLVKFNRHHVQTLNEFSASMYSLPEVQVCLHLSGEFDFLLHVSLKDPQEYDEFLNTRICNLPMLEKVQSSLVLRECKMGAVIPLL